MAEPWYKQSPTPVQPRGDKYDSIVRTRATEEAYGNTLDPRDPAKIREANNLARKMGENPTAVAADLDGFKSAADNNDRYSILGNDTHIASFVADPHNASAVKDDLPSLASLSAIVKLSEDKRDPNFSNYMKRTAPGNKAPLLNAFGISTSGADYSFKKASSPAAPELFSGGPAPAPPIPPHVGIAKGLKSTVDNFFIDSVIGGGQFLADAIGEGETYADFDYVRRQRELSAQAAETAAAPAKDGGFLQQSAYQALQSLSIMGASIATGAPVLSLATGTGLQTYEQSRNRGAGANESAVNALVQGTAEGVFEKYFGLGWMLGNFGKKATGKFLGGLLLREVPSEVATTAVQDLSDALTTGGEGWDSYVKRHTELSTDNPLIQTAASTALMVGVMGGPHYVAHRLNREARAVEDIEKAAAGAQFLDDLMTASENSKVRKEDPETFRQFVAQRTESSPVRNVYLPVEDAITYMQSENYDGSLDKYADQIAQAQTTKGDIVIPVADAAAHLSGTQAWEALKESVRIEPGGLSQKEALAKHDEIVKALETRGKEIAQEAEDGDQKTSAAAEVYTEVKNRLRMANVDERQSDAIAQLYAARYEARASRRGGTPMEQFRAAGIVFPGEQPGQFEGGREVAQTEQAPLEGMPRNIKVGDQRIEFGPLQAAREAARTYAEAAGLPYNPPRTYARVDPVRAARIAQAFEDMPHNPNDPAVRAAYTALKEETLAQWKAIEKTGLKVEFIKGEDPYGNPRNAILDVINNNHLWVFPTDAGFGGPASKNVDVSDNPLLEIVPGVKIDGREVRYNDLFRIVHDYFGHIKEGVGFRADGEENAWRIHSAMFSPLARAAMTTETRGQNSWVNFGPHGEKNRTANAAETEYAPQKIGLLPDWVQNEGLDDRTLNQDQALMGWEGLSQHLTDEEKAKVRPSMQQKIVDLAETLPHAEEMAAAAAAGRAKRGWYEQSAQAILDVFGPADAPRFAALLASLSPQVSVEANLFNALRTWTLWNDAGRPQDRATIVQIMGEAVQGKKGTGSVLNAWINNSFAALTTDNFTDFKLSGPKVDSFASNLMGVVDEVTNDTWMAMYAGLNAMSAGGRSGKTPLYKAMNAVVRRAADILTEKTGETWTPAEVQETVWSFAKTLYEMRDRQGEDRTMRQLLEAGGVTHEDIANTPDFAVLFSDGVFRTILSQGGYGQQVATLERRGRASNVDGKASVASAEGTGFSESDFQQFLGQAAQRLEAVRQRRREEELRRRSDPRQRTLFQDVFTSVDAGITDPVGVRHVYHGTPFDFETFSSPHGNAVWFSEDRDLAGRYANPRRVRMAGEGRVLEGYVDIQAPLDLDPALRKLPEHTVVENPVEWAHKEFGFDLKKYGWEKRGQDYAHQIFRSAAFADAARAAGYDALHVTESGHNTWGMLKPGSVISTEGRTLFQSRENAFYSAAERVVENSKQEKASAAQWKALLTPGKTPGIKSEEIEWTGIHEWLDMQKGPIEKGALLAVLQDRGIKVEEVVLGRPVAERLADYGYTMADLESGDEDFQDPEMIAAEGEPQFQQWSSDPSNPTYRELLITLPLGQGANPERAPSTHWDTEAVVAHVRFMEKTDAEGKKVMFIEEVQSDWHQKGRDQGYEQAATPEQKAKIDEAAKQLREAQEVLGEINADITRNEKAISEKIGPYLTAAYDKMVADLEARAKENDKLTPEAVQTFKDVMRTQTGAGFYENYEARGNQAGYVGYDTLRGWLAAAQPDLPRELGDRMADIEKLLGERRDVSQRVELRRRELSIAQTGAQQGIPDAPFKSSWPALVMKRAIRWAVDAGADKIAWTTGEEQAERYNLSQTVGSLNAALDRENGLYRVGVDNTSAQRIITENYGSGPYTREQLGEIFGRDMATRIAEKTEAENEVTSRIGGVAWVSLKGDDLRVGGEGMKAFYDRNLVNITNDIIKKYGVKVGQVVLEDPETRDEVATMRRIADEAVQALNERYAENLYDTANRREQEGRATKLGFEINDKLREAASGGFPLFQGERGSTTFTDNQRIIQLFATADRSTLFHETMHIWLEELRSDALAADATAQDKADWATLKKWWRANGITVRDNYIPTEAHELFARGGERWVMEGKAPSVQLQGVFRTFKAWLLRIYHVVDNLRSPITPEVRDVMNRLVATQDAIDEARRQNDTEPLFKSAEDAGMTDAEFADYQQRVADARDEAYDALLFKTMEKIRRERTKEMRDQRAAIRSEVSQAINSQPQFRLLHLLRTGRWLGDPDRPPENVKLNTGWLIDNYGEAILDKLPRGLQIYKGDGLDGDTIAEMVGMSSGSEVVNSLLGMRAASDALRARGETRSMRDVMVSEEVDRIMAERHGDTLTDGSIEEEAIAALNTARQGEIIGSEIKQLAKRKTVTGTPTPYQFARDWAKRTIASGTVRDVASRSALQRYIRASNKAARLAEEAILAGDINEAYRQKQAQLLNHALLAEAKAAADRLDKIVARMRKLGGRAAMKSVDPVYMSKIHMLLENYDFRPRSERSIDEQLEFQDWIEAQRAKGFEVHIPPRLENKGDPYTRVSVQELESLNDVVESLLALGRTKMKLKVANEERTFAEFRDEALARMEQLPDRKLPDKPVNEERRRGVALVAELLKVEAIVEELDGGQTGPLHDTLILGATEAENKRHTLREKVLKPLAKQYLELGRKHWKRLQEKVTIPELTWNTLNEGDPRVGTPVTITRMELLAVFMNMGNLSNLEKLSKGERWPVETLRRVMDRELTKEDYDLAQTMWDQVGALWPDIVATEQRMSGVVPEKVVNAPISTRFGEYAGGYWPVVYDASRWQRAEEIENASLDDMFGIRSGVATQKGHTISRTGAFGPINMSLERVLFSHVEQAITRIAYAPYARDVLRIIRDKAIRGMIDTKIGPEYRKQIEPWLAQQIHSGAVHPSAARAWDGLLRKFRINMTIAAMGFRYSVGAAQTLGLAAGAQRIGAKWVALGMKRAALHPIDMTHFMFDRSPEMRHRTEAVNREVAEVSQRMAKRHKKWQAVQNWAMWHIGFMDRYFVSMPIWLGAHAKGLKQGLTDEEASAFADKAVRMSQGTGRVKDMAARQLGTEAERFFTMFYTPFNVMFNAQWQGVRGLKRGDPRPMIAVTFWWLIMTTLGDALMGGDWPKDDDGDGNTDWGDLAEWFGRNVFFGLWSGIPIARDVANYAERKLSGQYAGSIIDSPVSRVAEAGEKAVKAGDKAITEGEAPQRPIKQTADLMAILLGVPVSQAGSTTQFLWDVDHGEQDPQSVSDWYFGLTRGKVPENSEAQR